MNTNLLIQDYKNIVSQIKSTLPEIKLIFDDIGLVGPAIKDWETSVPMNLIDEQKSIWELEIELKSGHVKFWNSDSWTHNWGGTDFPKGKAVYYQENIPVKAGKYKITLNLDENTYHFQKLD